MKKVLLCAGAMISAAMFITDVQAQDDGGKEFAAYGVGVGISPFGPSLGFSHNLSEKTNVMDEIPNTIGYGRVLPNIQLTVNYGF